MRVSWLRIGLFRGVLGILIGAGLYSEVYPFIQNNFLKLGDYSKLTLPTALDVDPWIVIVPAAIVMGVVLMWFEKLSK
jgi:ABC-type antimicrobial peptide transport system permease subunit